MPCRSWIGAPSLHRGLAGLAAIGWAVGRRAAALGVWSGVPVAIVGGVAFAILLLGGAVPAGRPARAADALAGAALACWIAAPGGRAAAILLIAAGTGQAFCGLPPIARSGLAGRLGLSAAPFGLAALGAASLWPRLVTPSTGLHALAVALAVAAAAALGGRGIALLGLLLAAAAADRGTVQPALHRAVEARRPVLARRLDVACAATARQRSNAGLNSPWRRLRHAFPRPLRRRAGGLCVRRVGAALCAGAVRTGALCAAAPVRRRTVPAAASVCRTVALRAAAAAVPAAAGRQRPGPEANPAANPAALPPPGTTPGYVVPPYNEIGTGQSLPTSNQASNIDSADTRSLIAPRLPTPPVGEDAPFRAYLSSARQALASGQTGVAQEALERAETRLLDRSVAPSRANDPITGPVVQRLGQARHAIAAGDLGGAIGLIDSILGAGPPPPQ